MSGIRKAITDLSRACSPERVFDTIAITVVQAQALEASIKTDRLD